jgi:carboxyl-terminal processing protease
VTFSIFCGEKKEPLLNSCSSAEISDEALDFTIIRDKIPIYSLDASFMLDNETGLIKLNKFSATTTEEFTAAVNELKDKNMKNLILDLRGNGGGYLKTAIEISDQFLENNKLIVYTDGNNDPKREYKATSGGIFKEWQPDYIG